MVPFNVPLADARQSMHIRIDGETRRGLRQDSSVLNRVRNCDLSGHAQVNSFQMPAFLSGTKEEAN